MLNGWSLNWKSMVMREGEKPRDTLCRKLFFVVYVLSVTLPSLIDAKRQFLCP
jgi:hypothetical protein